MNPPIDKQKINFDIKKAYILAVGVSVFAVLQYNQFDLNAYFRFFVKVFFTPASIVILIYLWAAYFRKYPSKIKAWFYAFTFTMLLAIGCMAIGKLCDKMGSKFIGYLLFEVLSTLIVIGHYLINKPKDSGELATDAS